MSLVTQSFAQVPNSCRTDAMIVFDASGSMAGMSRTGVRKSRIDQVREALQDILPRVEDFRHIGLMVYGSGEDSNSCRNIDLRFSPIPKSARRIIGEVNALVPSGNTPLTESVRQAAEILKFREKEAVIVLLTDGEETCGGQACPLARQLRKEAFDLTIHVIDYTIRDPYGKRSGFKSQCLVKETGGVYVPVESKEELVRAFRKVLGCALVTQSRAPKNLELLKR